MRVGDSGPECRSWAGWLEEMRCPGDAAAAGDEGQRIGVRLQVGGLPPAVIPVHMAVVGCPISSQRTTYYTTDQTQREPIIRYLSFPTAPPLAPPPSRLSTPTHCCPAGPVPPSSKAPGQGCPKGERPLGHGCDLHISEGSGRTGVSSWCCPTSGPRSGPLTGVSVVGQGGWRVGRRVTGPVSSPGSQFTEEL